MVRACMLGFCLALLVLTTASATRAGPPLMRTQALSVPGAPPSLSSEPEIAHPAIIGGTLAPNGAWPMTVLLSLQTTAGTTACGGTVIAPYFILTAAHCVATDAGQASITAASARVATNDASINQIVWATFVGWHSSYRGAAGGYDLALLRLAEPLTVTTVSLSTLADDSALTAVGTTATAVGWGVTSENDTATSQFLRQVDLPLVANAVCAAQTGFTVADSQACAGEAAGGKDTCQGDSGGPLFVRDASSTYRQVGITSYGAGCAQALKPGIYTRVASFHTWIQDALVSLAVPTQYTGWWWSSAEPGTGFSFEKNGDSMFVAVFSYRSDGTPAWYVATGKVTGDNLFSADFIEYSGGQSLAGAWQAASAVGSPARLTVTFTSSTTATLTIGSRTVSAQRFPFADSYAIRLPASGSPEAGWWWNAGEPGRGFYLDFQNSRLYLGGYMYDALGVATWYLAEGNMTSATSFTGTLQQFSGGQTLTGTWQAVSVSGTAGTISVVFTSTTTATLTLPNGTSIALTRFAF